jgi:hypothetical protein
MAPSNYNSQPWRFRIDGSLLEIFADPRRQLHVVDGDRRAQIQSCGCALYNARVAVRVMGFEEEVTLMLADAEHPDLLATLVLGARHITTDDDHDLMRSILLRRTNRRAFEARPVPALSSDLLISAAADEGVTMVRLDPSQKHAIATLIDQADRMQYADPSFRAEIAQWLIPFGSSRRDGIPFSEKEYGSVFPFTMMRSLRSPHLGDELGEIEQRLVEDSPAVFVIGTDSDDPVDWLRSGEALEAVLLRATNLGLSASFLNQVLESPGLRSNVAMLAPTVRYPQMVFRLGVPEDRVHRIAPRRDVSEVLEVVG